jgi:hypothetical protein
MSDLASVAKRLEREVGLPPVDAKRIAKKLNRLAASVSWATPVPERDERQETGRPADFARRKTSKRHSAKKR